MALANGVYIVRNTTKAYGVNKVLDISTGDGTTILGYNEHDGPNQQWYIFKEDTSTQGDLYSIRDGYYGRFLSYSLASSTAYWNDSLYGPAPLAHRATRQWSCKVRDSFYAQLLYNNGPLIYPLCIQDSCSGSSNIGIRIGQYGTCVYQPSQ
ncbi:hypothetical protein H2248_007997 [Termitomyces sp. 'cryptogamus']|nr:hypothetical protein H2248_007997 [Termitomyces sp. 'cryptogamus']